MSEESKENSVIYWSIDFKESYWDQIKENPSKLSELMTRMLNSATNLDEFSKHSKSRAVCTDFNFVNIEYPIDRLLEFQFEIYDVSDPEEEKKYMDKLDEKERECYKMKGLVDG